MNTTKLHFFIICSAFVISCGNQKVEELQSATIDSTAIEKTDGMDPRNIGGRKSEEQITIDKAQEFLAKNADQLLGYWVGPFGNNMINLTLAQINDKEISGFSICAGNYREIKGTIEKTPEGSAKIIMEEPGDDKYDGRFEFTIDKNLKAAEGKWTPFKSEGNKAKTFALAKTNYMYDNSVGEYPQASQKELTEGDVENYTAEELEIMRNEIYARHGYSFKNKKMRAYFEKQDWYIPMGVDIRSQITDIEAKNIELIYRYEEYYKVHYDDYGR